MCAGWARNRKMTLKEFIPVFSEYGKLNTDMCIIKYDGADCVSSEFKLSTRLSEIPSSTSINMDSKVCYAYYEDGCLFIELESDTE